MTATATPAAPAELTVSPTATLRALAIATDTKIAVLDEAYAKLDTARGQKVSVLRSIDGQEAVYVGRRRTFTTPIADTIASVEAKLAAGTVAGYEVGTAHAALAAIASYDEQIAANRAAAAELHQVWADNGYWTRFFTVQGGHIHNDISTRCSRTWTTVHGWNPELSGATEAAAVAELGPLLCTHCFPTAPVEFTVGHAAPARCPGSDAVVPKESRKRVGMNVYGPCQRPGCEQYGVLVGHGTRVRKHKPGAK